MSGYEELRRLAEAATPGPWWHAKSISYRAVATLRRNQRPELIPGEGAAGEATAAYIAAASPDVILALLDERERLQRALERFGLHSSFCLWVTRGRDCDCGLDLALKGEPVAVT